jgi:hypothetical protein
MRKPRAGAGRARDPGPGRVTVDRRLLWALGAASAAIGLGLVPLLATSDFLPDRGLWIVLDLVIGGGFTAVGLFAWYRRPDNRVGALMVATAFAWYAVLAGNTEPPLLWTLGNLLSNLFAATAIHLLLAFPSGRLETRVDRLLVGLGYVATTIGFLPFVLFTDPAAEFGCTECPENLLLIDADPGFRDVWLDGLGVVGITLLLTVVARLVQRWRTASPPLRRAVEPVFLVGAALMVTLSALLAAGLLEPFGEGITIDLFYACMVAFGLVPYVFLAGLVRGRWLRGRGLGTLINRLGQPHQAGSLREELARALGDPSVELAYWLPDSGQHVDAEGRPVELPPPGAGRAVTEVERDGRRIGAIVHDTALLDDPEQVRAAGVAAALALENARLEAELRAKVEELRASRAVSSSRATRRAGASSATYTTALSSASCPSPSACGSFIRVSPAIRTPCRSSTPPVASSTRRSESCASSPAASIPRCSQTAASMRPSTASPAALRCRWSSRRSLPSACRIASSPRPTSWWPRRSPTSPSTHRRPART